MLHTLNIYVALTHSLAAIASVNRVLIRASVGNETERSHTHKSSQEVWPNVS